ncbi:MAG: hypothetical protein IPL89_17225 [Acidobacteria bacterium]|nr:hypothetical protein [Acidobacteriota bacterium]
MSGTADGHYFPDPDLSRCAEGRRFRSQKTAGEEARGAWRRGARSRPLGGNNRLYALLAVLAAIAAYNFWPRDAAPRRPVAP